jgi:hypothetical protein
MNRVAASDCEEKADESQDVARDLSDQLADLVVSDNDIRT